MSLLMNVLFNVVQFTTGISTQTFMKNVNEIGIAIMGQTAELAPADKKLYALRDVTATVDNMSLIESKKNPNRISRIINEKNRINIPLTTTFFNSI